MPGLAKALRHQATPRRSTRPDRFFDTKHIACLGVGVDANSTAIIHFDLGCTAAEYVAYCERLTRATEARIRCSEDNLLALDLLGPRRPVGRLTTDLSHDAVAHLAAAIDASGEQRLGVYLTQVDMSEEDCAEIFFLPVTREIVTTDEFHGEPIVIGTGEFCAMTINRHDGTIYVHRFESAEEARRQHERNVEADLPFAGAALN